MPQIAHSTGLLADGQSDAEGAAHTFVGKQILLALFVLTIVFDFRRLEGDDSNFVVIMGIANVLLGAWFCLLYQHFTTRLFFWICTFVLFIGLGTLSSILYDREIYRIFASTVPVLSFLFAATAVYSMRGEAEKRSAIRIIITAAIVAALVKFVFGFYYYERDLENVRYQIISGSVPLLFAYGFAGIFSKEGRLALISVFLAVLIVVVSVTRTYIVVFGVSALVCFYAYSKTATRLAGVVVTLGILAVLAFALTEIFPDILGRWSDRLSVSEEVGFDLTAAYRLAETEFQLRQLWADMDGLLFGFGHAAPSGLAGDYVRLLISQLGPNAVDFSGRGYGHNLYVGLVYVGGLVGGLPVMAALFHLLFKGLRHARRTSESAVDQFLLTWGVSAFAGYLASGALAGSFSDRSISFFFGISAGLVLLGTEPARHVLNQVATGEAEMRNGLRTPRQRRAALAREGAAR